MKMNTVKLTRLAEDWLMETWSINKKGKEIKRSFIGDISYLKEMLKMRTESKKLLSVFQEAGS